MSTLLGSKLKQKLPSPKKQQYKELMILQKNEVTVGKNSSTSYLFDDKGIMKSETKVTSQKRVLKESPTTPPPPLVQGIQSISSMSWRLSKKK